MLKLKVFSINLKENDYTIKSTTYDTQNNRLIWIKDKYFYNLYVKKDTEENKIILPIKSAILSLNANKMHINLVMGTAFIFLCLEVVIGYQIKTKI